MVYNQKIVKIKPLRDNVEQSQKIATGFSYYQDEIIVRKKKRDNKIKQKKKIILPQYCSDTKDGWR